MRLLLATAWVLLGAAMTSAVYWGFLITPESTVPALMLSAVLGIIAFALVALTANGAIVVWEGATLAAIRRALRAVPAALPAALIVLAVWWMTSRAENWVAMRSGQISAWFIARLGWDDVSTLFSAVGYLAQWLRWVIAPLLALSLLASVIAVGWRGMTHLAWLRRALHPRALAIATVLFVTLIAVPWTYLVPWRPTGLPVSSVEFAFIVVKLSVCAILAAVGLALIAREASLTRHARPATTPNSSGTTGTRTTATPGTMVVEKGPVEKGPATFLRDA